MRPVSIDVIIPVYNGMPFIERTVAAALNQTLKPKEVIVVNDGSTDGTLEKLMELQKAHPDGNLRIINKKNGGHSSATNEGIRASTADYIALVDADDLWAPTKLEKQYSVFKNSTDPLLGIVYSDYINIDPKDAPLPEFPSVKLDPKFRGRVFESLVLRGNYVMGSNSAVLVKREVFQEHGFFDENLRCGEDWEMWIRMARTYNFDYYPEVLTYIRRHGGNLSNQKMLHCKSDLYIIHKWRDEFHRLGGRTYIADYLARSTFRNQFNLFLRPEHEPLLAMISEIAKFRFPRLILAWAFGRKIRKRAQKQIQMLVSA